MPHSGAMAMLDRVAAEDNIPVPNAATEAVARLVEAALWASPYPELQRVKCESKRGALVLAGKVSSFFLKQIAQTIASKAASERQVVNRIQVEYASKAR